LKVTGYVHCKRGNYLGDATVFISDIVPRDAFPHVKRLMSRKFFGIRKGSRLAL
jgi:hypothetical protein